MVSPEAAPRLVTGHLTAFDVRTVYDLCALRADVFTYEQRCTDVELDGRDLDPDTEVFLMLEGERVIASLRVLHTGAERRRVGRVVTRADRRGAGHAGALLREAIARYGNGPLDVGAQAHLEEWYGRFGFVSCGDLYDDGGIAHVPMLRSASASPAR